MMDEAALTALTQEIMAQGYDEATASRYAVLIGDTPVRDAKGNVLVMDGDRIMEILPPLKFFSED